MTNLNLLKILKNMFDDVPVEGEVEQEVVPENPSISTETTQSTQPKLTPFESSLNNLYIGCFTADPVNPIVADELDSVDNQEQCITMGQTGGYDYAILQNGNICLGANKLNFKSMQSVPRTNCNSVCDESSAGFCGGSSSNQIYATSLAVAQEVQGSTSENFSNINKYSTDYLEKFASETRELQSIGQKLSQSDMINEAPVNKYNLFLSVMIMIFLTYIIIECMNKK